MQQKQPDQPQPQQSQPTSPPTQQSQKQALKQRMQKIRQNHPDCIPILFMKHPQAPPTIKPPTNSFILFKKQLQIEQAMFNLYKQIQQKGLYFFCPYLTPTNQLKYTLLKPGPKIEQIYKKYGRGGYLTIVYADKNLGMGGLMRMERWVVRVLCVVFMVWVWVYGYAWYVGYRGKEEGGDGGDGGIGGNGVGEAFGDM